MPKKPTTEVDLADLADLADQDEFQCMGCCCVRDIEDSIRVDGELYCPDCAGDIYQQGECQWFMNCHRPAVTTRKHPILPDVPICDKCNKVVDSLSTLCHTAFNN